MADTVSSIRINTKLVTDGIKKDKKEIVRQLRELQKNAQSVKISKEIDRYNSSLDKSKAKIKELEKAYEDMRNKTKAMKEESFKALDYDPDAIKAGNDAAQKAMDTLLSTASDEERSFVAAKAYSEKLNEINEKKLLTSKEYRKQIQLQETANQKLEVEREKHADILKAIENKRIEQQIAHDAEMEERKKLSTQFESIDATERHTKSIKNGIKSITKMSLAVLGVRAAYAAVRKIVSSVTDDNEKLANTIDAIWAGLGSAFEPIINGMIQGFATVLNYAFAIINALTGINLIAKANKKLQDKKKGESSSGSKLASFDSSEVLKKDSGSGSSTTDTYLKEIELNEKLLSIIKKIRETWGSITEVLKPVADFLWENLISPIGEWFGSAFVSILVEIGDGVLGLVDTFLEFSPGIVDSLMGLTEVLVDLWETIIRPLLELVVFGIKTMIDTAHGMLEVFIQNIHLLIDDMKLIFEGIINFLTGIFTGNWDLAWQGVAQIAEGVWNFIAHSIDICMQMIVEGVRIALEACISWLSGFESSTDGIIADVILILEGLIDFVTGIFTGDWEKAWFGVKKIFVGIWNGIIDIVQSAINGIISGVNAVVNALNSISVDIPDWVPFFGGQSFGIHLNTIGSVDLSGFKIPELAKGAVLPPNQPFVAMLGDQTRGRNLEAPEGLIRQIIQEELSGFTNGTQVIIKADGDLGALIRLLRFEIDEEDKRTGTHLVLEG